MDAMKETKKNQINNDEKMKKKFNLNSNELFNSHIECCMGFSIKLD